MASAEGQSAADAGTEAVTLQPLSARPAGALGGLSGLEILAELDQLHVDQKIDFAKVLLGWESNNKYKLMRDSCTGQQLMYAREDTDFCTRQCCGPARPFHMSISDSSEREVLHLRRPLNCQSPCAFPCLLQELEVSTPDGQLLGTVRECWTVFHPKLTVHGADEQHLFTIRAPFCGGACHFCAKTIQFGIFTPEDGVQEVGNIGNHFAGLARELFTDSDVFSITFPPQLDVSGKAILLGALFLIDFMFFEKGNNGLLSKLC